MVVQTGVLPPKRLNDGQAAAFVQERVDMAGEHPERRPLEQMWWASSAYLIGQHHFVERNYTIGRPQRVARNKEFHKANFVRTLTARAVAKLDVPGSSFGVAPLSGDREDIRAARVAMKVFEFLQLETDFETKMGIAELLAATHGSSFLKVNWRPNAGTPERVYLTEDRRDIDIEPFFNDELRQYKDRKGLFRDIQMGEVDVEVCSAFKVFWDPDAREGGIDQCDWMALVQMKTIDKLVEEYGPRATMVTPSSDYRGAELYEEGLAYMTSGLHAGGPYHGIGTYPRYRQGKRARVISLWQRPLKSNGYKGRYIVVAEGTVLENRDNPYVRAGIELPFVKVDWDISPGRFIGLGLVENLRPSQRAYNMSRSIAIEYEKTHGYAPTWLPKGSGVERKKLVNMPGVVFEYNRAAGVPVFGRPPELPEYIARNALVAQNEMMALSAQAPPEMSKLPGQLRSGHAVHLMQADNNLSLTGPLSSKLRATARVGTMMLKLVGHYYDTPRTLQHVSKAGAFEVEEFTGAQLRGHYQVRVLAYPKQLESPEAYRARLLDLVELGVLNGQDPEDKVLVLRSMEVGSVEEALASKLIHEQRQEREIERMIEVPEYLAEPQPWEDHSAHVRVLERMMNGTEWDDLDQVSQQKLIAHWQAHTQILQEQVQAQLQAMELSRGTGGEKGQASQPRKAPRQ